MERKRIWVSLLPPLGLYHLSVRFTFAPRAHSSQNYLDAVMKLNALASDDVNVRCSRHIGQSLRTTMLKNVFIIDCEQDKNKVEEKVNAAR